MNYNDPVINNSDSVRDNHNMMMQLHLQLLSLIKGYEEKLTFILDPHSLEDGVAPAVISLMTFSDDSTAGEANISDLQTDD